MVSTISELFEKIIEKEDLFLLKDLPKPFLSKIILEDPKLNNQEKINSIKVFCTIFSEFSKYVCDPIVSKNLFNFLTKDQKKLVLKYSEDLSKENLEIFGVKCLTISTITINILYMSGRFKDIYFSGSNFFDEKAKEIEEKYKCNLNDLVTNYKRKETIFDPFFKGTENNLEIFNSILINKCSKMYFGITLNTFQEFLKLIDIILKDDFNVERYNFLHKNLLESIYEININRKNIMIMINNCIEENKSQM